MASRLPKKRATLLKRGGGFLLARERRLEEGGGGRTRDGAILLPRVKLRTLKGHLLVRQHVDCGPQRLGPAARAAKHVRPVQGHEGELEQLREVEARGHEPRAARV